MNSQSFLDLLWANKPEHLRILIWTLQDKRSHWCRSTGEAAAVVAACGAMDTYVGVGLSPEDFGAHQRCPADRIAGIAALWADFDLLSDAHAKKALPATLAEALSVIPAQFPPTVTVATGNGGHAWWVLKEPLIFESDQERAHAAAVIHRWQTMLRFAAANRGWAFDRLADLPRVLRIPGTRNFKDPKAPKPVEVHELTDRRYNLSDFEDLLDGIGIPGPDSQAQTTRSFTEIAPDSGLAVNLNAQAPEELIRRWADADMRFRNTWFRQRHDLKDQSQSGYDLALADFGIDAGLEPQQIVDLIVHHRRLHNQKQRTRGDYFERTLSRAANRAERAAADDPPAAQPTGIAGHTVPKQEPEPAPVQGPGAPAEPADPLAAKAALCESISATLGIRILRLVKITGKEPTYQIELERGRIELANVSGLIEQKSLRLAIASAVNKIIPKIKPRVWERLAQAMLDALIEREGGVETEFEGAMRVNLGHYLTETAFIPGIEGQPSHAIRRPMIIGDQVAVNSVDLQLYLNKTFGQNLSVKAIASMLSAIGAQSIRVRGAKIREQGRWLLPRDQFDPADFTAQGQEIREEEEAYVESE
ncbi:MAG: hypothetical protein IT161_18375 [Bryobacterales bacterium]|nr:hypothetical protein [Bryobacterales bacterium]